MKKLALIIVVLAMAFALVACNAATATSDGATAPPAAEETISE